MKRPCKIKISDKKVKDNGDGTKTISFTYTVKNICWTPSDAEITTIATSDFCQNTGNIGLESWYAVMDSKTGIDLETDNKYDVTVKAGEIKYLNEKHYENSDHTYSIILRNTRQRISITYPKTYKNLCFGFGGSYNYDYNTANSAFWKGSAAFGKTTFYKEKGNYYFIKLS